MTESSDKKVSDNASAPSEKKKKAGKKTETERKGRPGLKGNHKAAS